ncbi:MAG: TIR domain-containing protein [Pseudomonadota bacterium]
MADVFLSYSREDQSTARRFAEGFEREGLSVWWDQVLDVGESFDSVTEQALDNAKAVVVLWSKRSVDSRWVRAEATQAQAKKCLVPVMIESCKRPIMFELTHTAELSNWSGDPTDVRWQSFIEGLHRLVGKSATGPGAISNTTDAGADELFLRPAVAVLPFANLSGEPEQEYFVDGITQDIVTALSYWRWFPVIARNSTLVFKKQSIDIKEIGKRLGAKYVLEGSVRKAGGRIRITAQLIDATNGHQLWSQRYDRDMSDIFEVQDEITESIVASLEPELQRAEQQRTMLKRPENLRSWDCCHRALAHQWKYSRNDYVEAIQFAHRAIEFDPASSYARSMLAICLFEQTMAGWSADPASAFRESFESASEAVALDEGDWLGHFMKGMGYLWTQRAHDLGTDENHRAVRLNPSAPSAHHGLACLLSFSGKWADAIPALHKVLRLDPQYRFAGSALADLSLAHLMLRDFDPAREFAEKAIHTQPRFVRSYQRLACCLGHMGQAEQARDVVGQLLQRQSDISLAYIDATYPFKYAADREFFLEGLHKAGLELR